MTKETIIYIINTAIKTVKPWKISHGDEEYQKGWNDCVKELNKRQKKYVLKYGQYMSNELNKLDSLHQAEEINKVVD